MIVFGIYSGCIHEGGNVSRSLYLDENKAIAETVKRFEHEKMRDEEYFKKFGNPENKVELEHHEQYKWVKCDKIENRWHNSVDEMRVVSYKVI